MSADESVWALDAEILLVEDDAADALLVEEMLADGDLEPSLTWCKTLAEAQKFLSGARRPVCVLLDLHLPDTRGVEAVKQVVGCSARAAVIVVTGLAEAEAGLAAVAAGAQDYLVKGLFDPETAVRGFALTGDASFLTPYGTGRAEERRSARLLEDLLADDERLSGQLRHIEELASAWREDHAEPLIAATRRGVDGGGSEARPARSKTAFDALRARFDQQERSIDAARDRARADISRLDTARNWSFALMVSVFGLAVVAFGIVLRLTVGRPLDRLRTASEAARAGSLDERIDVDGPSDVRALAEAVEAMRRRISRELDESRAREALLAEQTEELRRSNSELEQFAYVASHDLQEPLRKVASFCQLLEKRYGEELDDRGKKYIEFAVDGAKRMQVLINDLLTFSRVGRVHDARQPVPLDR
ncbi:response regulator [Streptomyces sp. GC420]|nr:response regulator [Streptomyces sp. GC420]